MSSTLSPKYSRIAGVAAIAAATLFVYWPALHGGWVFDDELDVTGNVLLRDASGLWKIWFNPTGAYDYYPIKYTVQWLQWHLWHEHTLGYHLTNVALHIASALLFWRVLARLGLKHGWFGGLLFAVHPLAVESVAWITELKNTLSLPLLLLALLRWLDFDDSGRRRDHAAAIAFFLAALLCKTSVVMFPCTLLVFAWWRRGRILLRDLQETAPFFALSLALGLVTVWFQHDRALGSDETAVVPLAGWVARTACAGASLAFYAWKSVVPVNLMTIYPHWPMEPVRALFLLPWLALAALVAGCWRFRATWGRHALLGLTWFVLNLLPILGFVTISSQRFTWVMDHLAYVALLGAIGLAVAAAQRAAVAALGVALCVPLAFAARHHAAVFRDEETLWTDNVARNPGAWMALYNLGNEASRKGRHAEAIARFQEALRLRPNYPEAWNNLGNELRSEGRFGEAIDAYHESIRYRPRHFAAHNNLGAALAASGAVAEGIAECQEALRINPSFALAERNLGRLLAHAGRPAEAVVHLRQALRLQPKFPEAASDLGDAVFDLGNLAASANQPAEALKLYDEAIRLNPQNPAAQHNTGIVLSRLGRTRDAIPHYEQAVRLKPDYVDALVNLAAAYQEVGNLRDAVTTYETARKLRPELPPVETKP